MNKMLPSQQMQLDQKKISVLENRMINIERSIKTLANIESAFSEQLNTAIRNSELLYQKKSSALDTEAKQTTAKQSAGFSAALKAATDKADSLYQQKSAALDTEVKQTTAKQSAEFLAALKIATDKTDSLHQQKFNALDAELKQATAKQSAEFSAVLKAATDKADALHHQIEGLLPGATATGLAAGFGVKEQSYKQHIKIYEILFMLSLGAIFLIGLAPLVAAFFSSSPETTDSNTIYAVFVNLLSKSTILFPILCAAMYFSARKSEAIRMKEEYGHKKEIAQTYIAYKKAVDELGDEDKVLKNRLLEVLLSAIEKNPSALLPINKEDGFLKTIFGFFHNKQG